jgi:hypothetical protein
MKTISLTTLCHYAECHYAEYRDLSIVMLSVVMLSVIMLNVVMLNVAAPNNILLWVIFSAAGAPYTNVTYGNVIYKVLTKNNNSYNFIIFPSITLSQCQQQWLESNL